MVTVDNYLQFFILILSLCLFADTLAMSGYQPTWINLLPVNFRNDETIENSWLHLGGTPQAPISLINNLVGTPGFTGCMQSLQMNGRSLNIYR